MGSSMPFMSMNIPGAGDMSMMYQGMMGGFNPMMGMGMGGMGHFGMGGMGGVGAMNPMATAAGNMGGVGGANMGMGGAGGVGAMRLGMGPIGMTGAGAASMGGMVAAGMGMGMGMRQGMGMMGGVGRARPGMNQGPDLRGSRTEDNMGPTRMRGDVVLHLRVLLYLGGLLHNRALFFTVTSITELLSALSIIVSLFAFLFVCFYRWFGIAKRFTLIYLHNIKKQYMH